MVGFISKSAKFYSNLWDLKLLTIWMQRSGSGIGMGHESHEILRPWGRNAYESLGQKFLWVIGTEVPSQCRQKGLRAPVKKSKLIFRIKVLPMSYGLDGMIFFGIAKDRWNFQWWSHLIRLKTLFKKYFRLGGTVWWQKCDHWSHSNRGSDRTSD